MSAKAIVSDEIPAVIATTAGIDDRAARIFAEQFYTFLIKYGHPLAHAFEKATHNTRWQLAERPRDLYHRDIVPDDQDDEPEWPWRLLTSTDEAGQWTRSRYMAQQLKGARELLRFDHSGLQAEQTHGKKYQVFLSHGEEDVAHVEHWATVLEEAGVPFWFGPREVISGSISVEKRQEAFNDSACIAILLHSQSPEKWQKHTLAAAITKQALFDESYRVIPVFLPGATLKYEDLNHLPFFQLFHPAHINDTDDMKGYQSLLSGIYGVTPYKIRQYVEAVR